MDVRCIERREGCSQIFGTRCLTVSDAALAPRPWADRAMRPRSRGLSLPRSSRSSAGGDPTREGRALQDALRRAIATRRGSCSWTVDHAGGVVTLHSPEEHDFYGKTLEEALAWCLVWLMAPELGIGPFLV